MGGSPPVSFYSYLHAPLPQPALFTRISPDTPPLYEGARRLLLSAPLYEGARRLLLSPPL